VLCLVLRVQLLRLPLLLAEQAMSQTRRGTTKQQ
jgi:hypothetical protein